MGEKLERSIQQAGKNLFEALVKASQKFGKNHVVVNDLEGNVLTYRKLILASLVLGRKFKNLAPNGEPVGVLLPNVSGAAVTFFALHAYGKTPAMLNFTSGLKSINACMVASGAKTILTARKFIEKAELQEVEAGLIEAGYQLIYLEDLRKEISAKDKVAGIFSLLRVKSHIRNHTADTNSPAVILFTSGSEGVPKGVVLSHSNLLANIKQAWGTGAFLREDRLFNSLPIFHSFGMTAGLVLPILEGMYCYLYPTPLHYKTIPEKVAEVDASIIFGTDTFLFGYVRMGDPENLKGLRFAIAGAEKLKDRTRKLWAEKTGVEILEGYGATETAPILSVNLPDAHRPGTVGRTVEGITCRLEPVPGLKSGGGLHVHGPNIMQGYMRYENPGVLEAPKDGWHDMGDIVEIDDDGYITIVGRTKRFAKIGGEMVSLAAIEDYVADLWQEHLHVAVALEDERKGEQVVLLTEKQDARREEIIEYATQNGISEIMLPRKLLFVEEIPLLGSGKTDFAAVNRMANTL